MADAAYTWIDTTSGGLLEAAPDAMVVIDASGVIVLANHQATRLFGWAKEELLGQPVELLIPEAVHEMHRKHRLDYVKEPRFREMGSGLDLFARRRDGSEFAVEISLAPLQTERGLLVSAAVRDITEKRREERLFRGLLEAAPDGMVIVDSQGVITLVNAQVEAMFGYGRQELVGQPVEMLVPERFAGMHERYRDGYHQEPRTRPMSLAGDLFARRKDGSEFPVEISLAPLNTDDGVLVSAAVRDITERRALSEAADRAKTEFFATVSHELRTPLTSLIGYGELLGELEDLSDQGRQFLSIMMRSAERERRLVTDLLTLVQIGDQGLTIRRSELDLTEVVRDLGEAWKPMVDERGQMLRLVVPDGPLLVSGDRDRLGQAVDNLLSNAVKFTPQGGEVRVVVTADDAMIHLDVIDSGPGIGDVDRARIFERLYRGPAAVAAQVPGAGLGLSIAQAIVEAHDGSIDVMLDDASGAAFRLSLPLQARSAGGA